MLVLILLRQCDDPCVGFAMTGWSALHYSSPPRLEPPHDPAPAVGDIGWKPLLRHQRADGVQTGTFNPGWSRIGWTDSALIFDFWFATTRARNRARRLNERTHELGDVGEIFLQCVGAKHYIEIHVTPENQRLQLAWSDERVDLVRKGKATLEEFVVSDPSWVESITEIAPSYWSARTIVPVAHVLPGGQPFNRATELLACVCRYDTSDGPVPVLSSTADFQGQRFHHRAAWHRVELLA
jgi:hypothetical protein